MKPEKIQKVFEEMKEKIAKEMFANQTVTDDMIKAQIAKGWMSEKDKFVCLLCKTRFASKVEDAKNNTNCCFCGNEFSF